MKTFLTVAAAALFLSSAALAEVWEVPSNRPAVSVDMPDSWQTDETETGLEGTSDDNAVYFALDLASPKKMEDVINDAADFLDQQGVTIDTNTQSYTEEKLNGRDVMYISWDGEDADGPASIGLAVLILDEKTVAVLTYWGTKGDEEKHQGDLANILTSIKPAE